MNLRLAFGALLLSNFFTAVYPVGATRTGLNYALATMAGDEFFVATADVPENRSNALARLVLTRTASGQSTVAFGDLVPEKTRLNGSFTLNPLYNQPLSTLTSYQTAPLVAFGTPGQVHSVALIQDIVNGSVVMTNTGSFGDALGAPTKNILTCVAGDALSIAQGFVFAAVSPSDDPAFVGQAAAGIGVAQILPGGIVPFDTTGGMSGPVAAPLTTAMMQIDDNGSIEGVSCLCFNRALNTLFVGLTTSDGGVAVMAGTLDVPSTSRLTGTLIPNVRFSLQPLIAPTCWDGDAQNYDYIVASNDDGIAIQSLDVLNASTGGNYLIVGRLNDALLSSYKRVCAVPLASSAAGVSAAQKNATTLPATHADTTQLCRLNDAAALVGAGDAPAPITAMHVYGDAVFISCAGDNDQTRGIFFSQALFNASGMIRGWSPWQTVFCQRVAVGNFGYDRLGRTKMVSGDGQTLVATAWGSNSNNGLWGGSLDGSTGNLVGALGAFFDASSGGVQSVTCVQAVADYQPWGNTSQFLSLGASLVAYTGRNRCALFLSQIDGEVVTASDALNSFALKMYDLADYDISLDMVTTAAVSRGSDRWFFVGGTSGVSVLSGSDGSGLGEGLFSLDALDDFYTFKLLKKRDGSDFTHVTQVLTDEDFIYVISAEGVYRIAYDADKFKTTGSSQLDEVLIASPGAILGSETETIVSASIQGDYLFLATTRGLWMNNNALGSVTNDTAATGWKQVMLSAGGNESLGVCAQLSFVRSSAGETGGMLVVLTSDVSLNVANVYRVDIPTVFFDADHLAATLGAVVHTTPLVSSNTKVPVATPRYYTTLLGQLREYFYTDGGVMIDAASSHHAFTAEGSGMLRVLPVSSQIGAIDIWSESLQPVLDTSMTTNTVTGIVRDLATGTIIVSGAWGIQILQ